MNAPWLVPIAHARLSQPDLLHELLRLGGIGQFRVGSATLDVLFHAAELAEFRLDHEALGMGRLHDALGDLDVLLERLRAGVDHDRAVETAVDAVHAGGFVAVVQMNREHRGRENLVGRRDQGLEHLLVGVGPRALGELDDERGLAVEVALEQAHGLLQVVDVVRADGVLAVGVFEQFFGCDDHVSIPFVRS